MNSNEAFCYCCKRVNERKTVENRWKMFVDWKAKWKKKLMNKFNCIKEKKIEQWIVKIRTFVMEIFDVEIVSRLSP